MMTTNLQARLDEVTAAFEKQFGARPEFVVRAPGRVNLIGEHTDYNEGFVFPAAIDREMLIAASPTAGREVEVYSCDYKVVDKFSLDDLKKSHDNPWVDYMRGTLDVLQKAGHKLSGFRAVLSGNVPQGAGLSSSAAYEVAVATLANKAFNLGLSGKEIALLSQKAENQFIGVNCGIMDQFISALGEPDSALFIDCRSLEAKAIPLNLARHDLAIVITNSGVQRGLVDSEYNARRSECEEGTRILSELTGRKLTTLRGITWDEFQKYEPKLPIVVAKRCRHVVSENHRVNQAVEALEKGDIERFGKLMNNSHAYLRDMFEVSCKELDILVSLTQKHPGVVGARMTGAGFGGCTVALMPTSAIDSFRTDVIAEYEKQTGKRAEVYVCSAVAGARVESRLTPATT
jgi:galactokinase